MSAFPRLAVAAAALVIAAPAAAQATNPARVPVQSLSDGLVAIMKGGKKLGFAGRAAAIAPVVDQAFDLPLLTSLTVGSAWTTASAADRAALIAGMRKLTINQYAGNFDSWSGQAFVIDSKVDTRGTDRLVKTVLTQPKADSVNIAYRLRQRSGGWKIIDVYYQNSISQVATRRADFEAILAKGGAKALIGHLNALAEKAAR